MSARCPHAMLPANCPTCSAREALARLQTTVDHLAANLMPGTARPWRTPQVSAEKRAELDRKAREDRLHIAQQGELPSHLRPQGVVIPPGESPAPYDLDIGDLLSTILAEADLMAERVAIDTGQPTLPPAASAFADPRPFLAFIVASADQAAEHLLEHLATWANDHVEQAAPSLGEIPDGQLLDCLCPWCNGRTGSHPAGGAKTMRVQTMLGVGPVVVCEGRQCEPDADSGTRWRGLPAWPQWEWDWLNDRLDRTSPTTAA